MKNPSTYLKIRVLGAIDYAKGKTMRERIREVSNTIFTDEDDNPRKFSWQTISTWYYRYKKYGAISVERNSRADKGFTRKIKPEELLEALNQVIPLYREKSYSKIQLYRACIEKGLIHYGQISQTTFYRFVNFYELLNDSIENNKKRLAFSMQFANQLWQADTMFGPHLKDPSGKSVPVKLIAFMDDASRLICHSQFYFYENVDTLISCIRSAFYKRGIPEQLYVDNGSIYTSKEITLICARVGCILRHAPVRDGAAKGKVERFFRTVRDKFLSRKLDLSSIDALNRQYTAWVEDEYNNVVHSTLGIKPIDRFNFDSARIKFLPPSESADEIFYNEAQRYVKKDNTFQFESARYEAPADLRDRDIFIRFERNNPSRIIVYYKDTRIGEARLVDFIANGLISRKRRGSKEAI